VLLYPSVLLQGLPSVVEAFVPFKREVSIIAVRSVSGEVGSVLSVIGKFRMQRSGLVKQLAALADQVDDS